MKRTILQVGGLCCILGAAAFAQAPAPGDQPTDPSAASSPHQRAAVKSPSDEAAATDNGANATDSATPHQKQVTKKKKHGKKKADAPPSGTQP